MSQLYVRVRTAFYTHRKTVKLRRRFGDDAFWIPPRLWAYAAENQPDGDLSAYSSEELAMLIGCDKHAPSMLEALLGAGFLDQDGKIHGWQEHNGYHSAYSDRAKVAANARWDKERGKGKGETERGYMKGERGDKHCLEHACSTRLHGIPTSEQEVIAYGKTLNPPIEDECCRAFFNYYEGQRRVSPSGEIFWVTSGDAIVTRWQSKLAAFKGNGKFDKETPPAEPKQRYGVEIGRAHV